MQSLFCAVLIYEAVIAGAFFLYSAIKKTLLQVPINDPMITSIKKCCDKYMREYPTNTASSNNPI